MTTPQGCVATLTLPNRTESVRPAVNFVVDTTKALNIAVGATPHFDVAVTEALTNAVKHGHSGDDDAVIVCEVEVSGRQLAIRIIDGGPGFQVPDRRLPDVPPDQLESVPESGYGLPIILSVFSSVRAIRVKGRFGLELCLPI